MTTVPSMFDDNSTFLACSMLMLTVKKKLEIDEYWEKDLLFPQIMVRDRLKVTHAVSVLFL